MDDLLDRFSHLDHYALLGVGPDADAATIQRSWRALLRRYESSLAAPAMRPAYERLRRAIDEAYAVLSDPIERYRYDQSRAREPEPPSGSRSLSDFTWVSTEEAEAEARHGAGASALRAKPEAPAITSEPLEGRVASLEAELHEMTVEMERLSVALQLTLAQVLEPDADRHDSLLTAMQTLSETRATLAAMQARREEHAGHWDQAATLWQRAARQRPEDPSLLMKASDALRRSGGDLDAAESLARRALAIDPDLAEAHAAIAIIAARRLRKGSPAR